MNSDLVKGMAIGVGAGLLASMAFPAVRRMAGPTMQAAIRSGVMAWERSREQLAEWGEYAEDMVAEARMRRPVTEGSATAAATAIPPATASASEGEGHHG